MDGWNFLEGPVAPRNELRRSSAAEEQGVDRVRRIVVEVLRDFPDAYLAVVERLRQVEARGET